MNEKMEDGNSIYAAGITEPADVIARVTERMLETRPRQHIRLRPYKDQFIRQQTPFGPYQADFTACWPDAPNDSIAYAAARFHADFEQEVILTANGSTKLWFNGKAYVGAQTFSIRMNPGWNDLLLQCAKDNERWGFDLLIGFPRYPGMWAKDYLFSTRPTFPQQGLLGEEGFAYIGPFSSKEGEKDSRDRLEAEALAGDFLLWEPQVLEQTNRRFVDFSELYGPDASCAYGTTFYEKRNDGSLLLNVEFEGDIKIWMDGQEVFRSTVNGKTQFEMNSLKSRGQVLIKCVRRNAGKWGFSAEITEHATGQRADGIPGLESRRGNDARWLYIGPFGKRDEKPEWMLERSFDVEAGIRFDQPYSTGEGECKTYWRLSSTGTFVRPYLDGFFFGQWFYAIQVGLYGLLQSAEVIGKADVVQYATDSMEVMAQYHDYALWDAARYGVPSLIPRAERLQELDPCGAIGVMFIETYERTGSETILPIIHRLADTVMRVVPRMEDGTFYRIDTMWADDFFMSCPFLVRMGRMTGETRYFDEVVQQAKGFHNRLWLPDKRLFAHIFFPMTGVNSSVPWGRGNGWILFALTELLLHLPDDHPGREWLLEMYRDLAVGIVSYQDHSGLWHQVLDESASYLETSCTAMFVFSLARGIRMGWLGKPFLEGVTKGWSALLQHCVDAQGNVYGVCLGSGCSMESSYYYDIPTHINDDHGTGIVLLAAAEMFLLAKHLK
ncbi:glycosyl hydrolase [Paenibacillus agaridevorans]|uniref:Glycosyl hydrolase n=1 Tax=Paenibacillus agaridevorans TaxID=171404 RepID=A0A2R5EWZ9_9BACL|nr:glycoside hydrolase family 88 protein [Paenibacillus agaridevorans]GBG11226.1 glycosyl hydrolase [Paenibacillus agaridevorans]